METPTDTNDPLKLKLSFWFADGTQRDHIATYPDDFTYPAPWKDARGRVGALSVLIPFEGLEGKSPLRCVDVLSEGNEIEFSKFWDLDKLYPINKQEFESWIFREVFRPKGEGSIIFLTQQILEHYHLHIGDRCAAAVIYAYRAMERMDVQMISQSILVCQQLITDADNLPENEHPRRGRQLLRSSLYNVLWQLFLSIDDKDRLIETLKSYVDEVLENSEAPPVICVNFIPASLLYGFLLKQGGHTEEAEQVLWSAYKFYRAKSTELPDNPTHFYEFSKPFEAASICLAMVVVLRGGDWPGIPKKLRSSHYILKIANRVKDSKAALQMEQNLFGMIKVPLDL